MKHHIFYVIIAIFLAGCATEVKTASSSADQRAKALKPPKGMALVYFVRDTTVGKPFATPIWCDGRRLGSTCGWYYVYAYITPGKHRIKSQRDNTTEIDVKFAANKIYYIEMRIFSGFAKGTVKLEQVDSESGREKLMQCTLSADNAAR